ncbi:MAG: HD domain-containing protein [Rhodocyclaceae bacterium]|nr:HD domain-containing protein [Rhodocyclaceae bacterium]
MSFDSPNQHCLDKFVKLAESQTVTATDDIYDDRGFKLWAKGVPVSRELQVKLVKRKLAKPIESLLTVEHAVSFAEIVDDCLRKLDQDPALQKIAGTRATRGLLTAAKTLPVPAPLRLLLTSAKTNDADTYAHTLQVVTICAGIAATLTTQANEANNLLMAAVLHDLGEIYINPEYMNAKRRLAPHEWKHVVSHPRIGQMLIQELTSLPAAVAQCVGQHHERHDGSGYPFQYQRAEQHRLAGWIAVADAAAALLASGSKGAPARIALALRIVPGEFDRDAAGVLIQALRSEKNDYGVDGSSDCIAKARSTLIDIENVRRVLHDVAVTTELSFARQTCVVAEALLHGVATAMRATGVLDADMLGESIGDPELLAEMHLIVREVEWRMRNLARNIYLRAESQPGPESLAALGGIIEMMDK